jgi:hypothetical protein
MKYVLAEFIPRPGFITNDVRPLIEIGRCTVLCPGTTRSDYDEFPVVVTHIIAFIAEPDARQICSLLGKRPLTSSEKFSWQNEISATTWDS